MHARAATTLLLLALAATSAHAAPLAVDAGSLAVQVRADPWRLTFVDAAGRMVLAEAAERSAGPVGSLGFRTAAGWAHATRLASSRRVRNGLRLVAETTDALGRRLAVDLDVDAEGVIALAMRVVGSNLGDVEALGVGFDADADERFLGFGERANAVDQRGQVLESYVADGPYQPDERELASFLIPRPGFRARDDATYFPVPWLFSSRGYGVLVDNDETSYFRLGTDDPERWSLEVTGSLHDAATPLPPPAELRLRVFGGPRPADVLRRFTERTGRQPEPDAPWVLGPWVQLGGSLANRLAQLAKLRDAGAPVSVVQTYTHYLPCGDHTDQRAAERATTAAYHAAGVAVTTYFNPMICETYTPPFTEASVARAFTRDASGGPYVYDYTGSTVFRVAQYDFSTSTGRQRYAERLAEAIEDGYDGWMEDFGEYTPLDAFTAGGVTGSAGHNRYPVDYHCGAHAFVRREGRPVVRFQRSGWTGVAPCAQVVWNGDPTTGWDFDGLTSAVWGALNMGMSGIAIWGSDVGGFFAFFDRALTPELLTRWVQFGAVSGVMRTQHNGASLPAKVRPQIYDDDQIANWKRYATLRTQLYPYVLAAVAEYRRSGLPIMRHLALVHPDDPDAVTRDDEFLFGPDLLAAPVLAPGAVTRDLYLPSGEWIDLWRAGRYDSTSGAFVLEEATLLDGPRPLTVPAPLDELPLLVRAGAVFPLLPAEVDTLADYGDASPDLVTLADRRHRLDLLAFPRGTSEAGMFESERLESRELPRAWELIVRGKIRREYVLQASLATLNRPFVPCSVRWDGRRLPQQDWSYDGETRVLRVRFEGQRGHLVVQEGCG